MRAIVTKQYGGPEVLAVQERPAPEPKPGHVLIEVKAFGLNHAEVYFRKGAWGDVAEISGIECVGLVKADPDRQFSPGQKVLALVGGMGRNINGSYSELTVVPASNVVAIKSDLSWEELAAIPESYATAWTSLCGILTIATGSTVVIRGATSALGQAAVNIAALAGAHVVRRRGTRNGLRCWKHSERTKFCWNRLSFPNVSASSISWVLTRFSTLSATLRSWILSRCCGEAAASVLSGSSAAAGP
jgi:NADPH:quinone reductase